MLKNLDIDLIHSEKKTLFRFLILYTFLCLLIFSFLCVIYFNFQKDLMLQEKRLQFQPLAKDLLKRLKDLHINFDKYKFYPRDERFNSAIYDSDKTLIFSTLKSSKINFEEVSYTSNKYIHFIKEPESFYLGARYVIIELKDDSLWLDILIKDITLFLIFAIFISLVFGYFLLELFLSPMRDAMHLLDRFIKDTTHELNTPISAILANIEMIDKNTLVDEKLRKKINRIELGAKTVSNIYEDLTFLTLKNKIISQNENLNLTMILKQRVEYFKSLAAVKKIKFVLELKNEIFFFADNKKITKLIDNLLSNAIKYNKVNGEIKIILKNKFLSIEDSGRGIKQEHISTMFNRYSRFDKSVGGFGIGLNIVSLICKEYNIDIKIESILNKKTIVGLKW